MPKYLVDEDVYNIPDDKVEGFEAAFPNARVEYHADGDVYHIPLDKREGFLKQFPNAAYEVKSQRAFVEEPVYSKEQGDYSQPSQAQRVYESRGGFEPIGQGKVKLGETETPVFVGENGEWRVPSPVMLNKEEEIFRHGNPSESEKSEFVRKAKAQLKKETTQGIDSLDETISDKLLAKRREINSNYKAIPVTGVAGGMLGMSQADIVAQSDKEMTTLQAAYNLVQDSKKQVERYNRQDDGFGINTLRSAGEAAIDPSTWDFGLTDMKDSSALLNVVNKEEKGEKLTDAEQLLLDASVNNALIQAYYKAQSMGELAGSGAVNMIPFMAQILLNPLSGLGRKASSAAAKGVAKYINKKIVSKGLLANAVKKVAPRASALAVGLPADMAAGVGMAVTTNAMRTAADANERQLRGEKPGEAWRDAVLNQGIEFASENTGRFFNPLFSGIGKVVGAGAAKVAPKSVVNLAKDISKKGYSRQMKDFFKNTQWDGFLEEYAEEIAGGLMNAAYVGDMSVDKVFSKDNLLETAAGLSVASVLFPTMGTINYGVQKVKQRKRVAAAEAEAERVFGKRWPAFYEAINSAETDDELRTNIAEVYHRENRQDVTKDELQALYDYVSPLFAYRAIRDMSPSSVADMLADDVYSTAYAQDISPKLANESYKAWENAGKKVSELLNLQDQSVEDWLGGRTVEEAANGDKAVLDALTAYKAAKADFEGRRDRYQQDKQRAYGEIDKAIDKMANNGMVYTTQLDGQPVNITGGDVVLNENGTVDYENSSDAFYVTMPDGTVRVMASENIPGMVLAEDADELKANEYAKIYERWRVEFDAAEMAEVPQAATVTIAGAQPTQHAIDDEVVLYVDGKPINATIAEYNEADDTFVLDADRPINGKYAPQLTRAELESMMQPNDLSSSEITNISNADVLSSVELTAMERVPKDENGEPIYEQVDSDTAWDAIVEQTEGDVEMAQAVADGMVADKEAALKKLEKEKAKGAVTIAEKIAAEKERKAKIEAAKQELAKWKEIAGVAANRKAEEVAPVEEVQPVNEMQPVEVSVPETEIKAENGNENGNEIAEVSNDERTEMEARIVDWLSEENLSRAEGKTREEIFEEFGNELMPIAYIPTKYISLVSPDLKDQRIYCGKGYFIDHALRNHAGSGKQVSAEDVDVSKYLNIQTVLDNPDHVKETYVDGKRTVVFIKKIGRFFAELTQVEEDGKIVLHKSLFNQKKEPYAKLNDIRSKGTSSEGGVSSISHADNSAPAISLESRGDVKSSIQDVPNGVSSTAKDTPQVSNEQENEQKSGEKVNTGVNEGVPENAETVPTEAENRTEPTKKVEESSKSVLNDGLQLIEAPTEVTEFDTADEFVAGLLGGIKITPESFRKETGLGIDEQRKLVGIIAGEDKGGVSVERASEIIAENYGEELAARGFHGDQQEIRDMLIDILSSGNPRSYVKQSKERRAAQWVEQATAEADAWAQSYGFSSYDDMLAYEEQLLPSIKERFKDFDEQTYWAILAENYNYDTRRESERVGNGSEVLQGERSVPSPRTENIGERNEGAEVRYDVQSSDKTADAQEQEEVAAPTLLDVVRVLYSKGKEVASKLFSMKFFDVAKTPKFMQELGLRGDKFTIRYGVISRHFGKDKEHTFSEEIWEQIPKALREPFAITRYYEDENKEKQKGYRLYTTLQLTNGAYVVVSAEVKSSGRNIEVNAINTIFGRNSLSEMHDEVIYISEKITPEQQSLLNGNNPHQYTAERESLSVVPEQSSLLERPNFAQYPTEQELSEGKDTAISETTNEIEEKNVEWRDMSAQERMDVAAKSPLTVEEINNSSVDAVNKANAVAFVNGTNNFITQLSYLKVYEDVRNRPSNSPSDNGGEDNTQLAETNDRGSADGRAGGENGDDSLQDGAERSGEDRSVADGAESSTREPDSVSGETRNSGVRGEESSMDGVSADSGNSRGGGKSRSNGGDGRRRGREKSGGDIAVDADAELSAAIEQFKETLSEFSRAGRDTLNLNIAGLNSKQLEVLPKLIADGTKIGYILVKKGVRQITAWAKSIKSYIGEPLTNAGLSDVEVDAFIKELWNSNFPIGEEVHSIAEWASIIGMEETKKAVKSTLADKKIAQDAAESINVKVADAENIAETLPFLLPQQQEDVLKAETQFFDESHNDREHAFGKGYMFTNGTGTGKTYTGLGIVKRFIKQGKGRILIVTPSQQKVTDWISDAKNLNINLRSLEDFATQSGTTATQTAGEGAVITTYANFRENAALLEDVFDLVVYDESHRLLENKAGTETRGARQHYMVTNRDEDAAFMRLREINPIYKKISEAQEKFISIYEKEIENKSQKNIPRLHTPLSEDYKTNFPKLYKAKEAYNKAEQAWGKEELKLKEQAKKDASVTKVVFLSATPFNTRDNLDYAERYIFMYPEENKETIGSYKHQSPRTRFYLDHFGGAYKFRYGRLESAAQNADVISRQEVAFSDYLQNTLNTMSGRVIDSEFDYSRDFPTVSLEMGERINSAIGSISEVEELRPLWSARNKVWGNYNYSSALFETMKVSAMVPRLKEHLKKGRKIVIFHRRTESKEPIVPPFSLMMGVAQRELKETQNEEERKKLASAIRKFKKDYADLFEWEQTLNYAMPREQLAEAFGKENILFFSGKESAKVKNEAVKQFNDDNSGKNIIVIQEASGKEGISLHDRTGKHQRVVITLALPQSPITALQIEGRIYRIGNKSNAIFEYPILGLNSEMVLFGQNFNNSVSTTENLALGSKARNLRDSFARGIEMRSGDISVDEQGVGGKADDAGTVTEYDPFDNSVLDYYTNQKITAKRDNREGVDYYPTPEPLGFMMNMWGRVKDGDEILEPSAGHGAIARYAPIENRMTAVEPSQSLFARLQIKAGGAAGRSFVNDIFENYNIVNKHDVILMNPPFGVQGKLAAEHVAKAYKHLNEGGRIVAIVPEGKAQDRIGKWLDEQKDAVVVGEVLLPDVTFVQAGTSIRCRVLVIDKISNEAKRNNAATQKVTHDLSYVESVEEFFETLRGINMPDRTIDTQLIMEKKARRYASDLRSIKGVKEVYVNPDSIVVRTKGWRSFQIVWGNMTGNALRRSLAQQYSNFAKKVPYADETSQEVMMESQEIICKLANMTEDEMERFIANPMQEDDTLYRSDDAYTADEISYENDPVSKALGRSRGTRKQRREFAERERQRMVARVENLAKKLNLDNVEIVTDASTLEGKKRTAKGFYSKSTGKITIVIPNHSSVADAEQTLLHEAVAHYGLRQLFGEQFDTFLDNVYNSADEAIRREIADLAAKNGWDSRTATEEYLATLAENTNFENAKRLGWWSKIKKLFLDMLHKIGFEGFDHVVLTDNELRYILWRSYENLREPGKYRSILGEVTDIAKQYELKVGNYAENVVKGANVAEESDAEYSRVVNVADLFNARHKGAAPVVVIRSDDSIEEQLAEMGFSQEEIDDIIEIYKKGSGAFYDVERNVVVLLNTNLGKKQLKTVLWHEAVHKVIRDMGITDEQLNYFFELQSDDVKSAIKENLKNAGYEESEFAEEYLAYYIQDMYWNGLMNNSDYDVLSRLNDNATDNNRKQIEFVQPIINSIINGTFGFHSPGNETGGGRGTERGETSRSNRFSGERGAVDGILLHNPASETNAEGKEEGVAEDDALFRSGSLRDEYDKKVRVPNRSGSVRWWENAPHRLKEAYQDSMSALKTLQDLISEETGNPIQSHENAYMAENRMSSENKAQADVYERDFYNPLTKAVHALVKAGSSYEELKAYIIAKHGVERNAHMRAEAEAIGENGDRDFSGLTALTGINNVADAEAEAQKIVAEYEKRFDTAELWKRINAATKETLRKSYDSGLMDKATYEKVRDMYDYYVPLRGWNCEVAANEYEYLTSNSLMLSPALKIAQGRTSLADDPLATIGFMAESSIVQGNRNRMKQKFLNFILNNPTDLVSVSEQWYVLDNATGQWEARNPNIPEDATGDEVAAIVEQFEQDMMALGSKATKRRGGLNLNMNITKREGQEHVVRVKRNGKEYCLYVNGNPRAAQAINGMTNPDANDSSLYKAAMVVKNWMATMFTSKNPAFIATNLSRDVIWSGTAVAIKENAAYTAQYTKNITESLFKAQLPRLLVKFKNGTLDKNNEVERYFDEFMRNGGETGFTQLNTVEDYKRNIERFVKEAQGKGSVAKKMWNGFFDGIEFLNRSAEDTTRFIVYMTSREMGRDVSRSIYDAKEITVNFNKKGSGGLGASVMNFCYIFFNATIQGLTNFGRLMANHPAKTTMALSAFTSAGFLVPMLNMAVQAMLGGDDDDNSYWDLPEWVRRSNIVLYVPWSKNGYMTIPLPHELRPFYGMGEIAYSCLVGKEDVEEGLKKAGIGFSSLLPIDFTGNGGNIVVNLTPTIAQPVAQIVANTDYFGKPIYKRHEWNEKDPEWTKAYKGTATWLVDGTQWLNEITGGDNVKSGVIDLNPALIEHIFESYTGGAGKTLNKAQKTMEMLWNEDLREWRNVPVISSFYQTAEERTTGSQINREYYNAVGEMEDIQHLFSGYKREAKMGVVEYAQKLGELIESEAFKRYEIVKGYNNAINKARQALKFSQDPLDREKMETVIMDLKVEMLEELKKTEKSK